MLPHVDQVTWRNVAPCGPEYAEKRYPAEEGNTEKRYPAEEGNTEKCFPVVEMLLKGP